MRGTMLAGGVLLTLTGCNAVRPHPHVGDAVAGGAHAVALLRSGSGVDLGRATATEVAGGIRFTVDARALPPGTHGAHVHTVGRCDVPDFTSAGPHWNPTGAKHGALNPMGPHQGDLPNLIVGADGRGTIGVVIPGASMAGLLDADGAALVIHASADDLSTDPSGNSGARIACGVFAAG